MVSKRLGKTLNSKELNKLIQPYRQLDNVTNLGYIAQEYLTLAAILVPVVGFLHYRAAWGLHWLWSLPVWVLGLALVGVVQHRLAGLGHEGAHYILFRNRKWNELASDIFCMFPVFATTEQYRLIHLGHHQYVNDWDRDPELTNLGHTRKMDQFPMGRWEFIYNFFIKLFWPPVSFRYLWDNIYVTVLGKGVHPYRQHEDGLKSPEILGFRLTSILGVLYVVGMVGVMRVVSAYGELWHQLAVPVAAWVLAAGLIYCIPEHWYFRSPLKKPVFSARFVSVVRMGFYIALMSGLSFARYQTGTDWAIYFWTLWVLPMVTAFPYYMLIRDIFQHANADDGRLTNSRVFVCDPITRWAFFVYGQDVHLTHHLYSGIPHYRLPQLHRTLMEHNTEYATHVTECHGMFSNRDGYPTMVDVMTNPTREPDESELVETVAH